MAFAGTPDEGMNFGTRVAFDLGMCTGPFNCDDWWAKYGYYVPLSLFAHPPHMVRSVA